jgi:hypothetical protein
MPAFRLLTASIFLALFAYTAKVVANNGLDLLPVFFGDIGRMGWPGQFNLDFLFMLLLSALWVCWRHRFSLTGLLLGLLALSGGALFLSAYLLIETWRCGGDARRLVLGDRSLER